MTSTRHDGDTWDLVSSVGATATAAAAARAIATRTDRRLIDDPFAEPLVRAVGVDLLTRLATGEVAPDDVVEPVLIDVAKGAYQVLRRVLPRYNERGLHADRDSGLGAGFPRVPTVLANRDRGL